MNSDEVAANPLIKKEEKTLKITNRRMKNHTHVVQII